LSHRNPFPSRGKDNCDYFFIDDDIHAGPPTTLIKVRVPERAQNSKDETFMDG